MLVVHAVRFNGNEKRYPQGSGNGDAITTAPTAVKFPVVVWDQKAAGVIDVRRDNWR